uniref:Reverse transcriptase/retrotransposon-derived protein RNase H-like domain-containing protein n=1 Tax=Lactuca sativa TaxID=4236 RepID=A0A9R1WGT1_LACSA|nr:hypothetical protein LSAT_V11C200081230 [Lactuca sativa]
MCQLLQKDVDFKFNEACKEAFNKLKELLTSTPIMQALNWDLPIEIMCDTSNYAIGVILVYSDHTNLKYLMTKKDANLRLIRWILLLQEFYLEIRDKSECKNLVADHLSCITSNETPIPLRDEFLVEHLFSLTQSIPWYVDIVNFLVTKRYPSTFTRAQKDQLKSDAKYYVWDQHYLRCVPQQEHQYILQFCQEFACGGHFESN